MNNFMFKKDTKQIFLIYDIKNNKNGYPHFLVYNFYNNNEWTWISAKHFQPMR